MIADAPALVLGELAVGDMASSSIDTDGGGYFFIFGSSARHPPNPAGRLLYFGKDRISGVGAVGPSACSWHVCLRLTGSLNCPSLAEPRSWTARMSVFDGQYGRQSNAAGCWAQCSTWPSQSVPCVGRDRAESTRFVRGGARSEYSNRNSKQEEVGLPGAPWGSR